MFFVVKFVTKLLPRIISKNDLGKGFRSSYWNVEMNFTKNNKRRDENLNKNMFFSCRCDRVV